MKKSILSLFLCLMPFLLLLCFPEEDADIGESTSDQCENDEYSTVQTYPYADAKMCPEPDTDSCNPCKTGSVCKSDVFSGKVYTLGGKASMYLNGGWFCTKSCSADSDCSSMDVASVNGYTVNKQSWSCKSFADGKFCSVTTEASSASSCGSCGTDNAGSCCGGAYCSGACSGSPCCN